MAIRIVRTATFTSNHNIFAVQECTLVKNRIDPQLKDI